MCVVWIEFWTTEIYRRLLFYKGLCWVRGRFGRSRNKTPSLASLHGSFGGCHGWSKQWYRSSCFKLTKRGRPGDFSRSPAQPNPKHPRLPLRRLHPVPRKSSPGCSRFSRSCCRLASWNLSNNNLTTSKLIKDNTKRLSKFPKTNWQNLKKSIKLHKTGLKNLKTT